MDALAAAIPSIADESSIPSWPALPASRTAEPTTAAPTSEPTATAAASATATKSRSAPSACSPRSARNDARLSLQALSPETARTLETQHRSPQSKIILSILQPVADRSIHQESFVGVCRWRRSILLRRGSRQLIQLVFGILRRGPEAALWLLGTLPGELAWLSWTRGLQFKRPFDGLRRRADLELLMRGLEPKHLDFYRIGSRHETAEFVGARFVGRGDSPVIALGGSYCRPRHRLAAKLDGSRRCDARLCRSLRN